MHLSYSFRCVLLLSAILTFGVDSNVSRADDDLIHDYRQLQSSYREKLAGLADTVLEQGPSELAASIRAWLPPEIENQSIYFDPDDRSGALPADGPFHGPWMALRLAQADALFDLACRAAESGRPALAVQLAVAVVRENPDHAETRRILGYERVGDQWCTPYARTKVEAGSVWHPRFGWIPASDVSRYDAGQRRRGRAWISAAEDARRHATIGRGWTIRTEHFILTTNAGLEEGVQLAAKLEAFHAIWRQLFAGYYLGRTEVEQLFRGAREARGRGRPHRVRYYASRDEYNAALRHRQPKIDQTIGIYFDQQHESHFFAGEDQHPATLFHETTHQLFQESRRTARNVGALDNFWVLEGVATYMESLAGHTIPLAADHSQHAPGTVIRPNGSLRYYTLGGLEAGRLPAARARIVEDPYYVPLADVVRLGKEDLQKRPDIAKLYSQFAGLTAFLIHVENGKYRESLVEYLIAVYSGQADVDTLAKLTGTSYPELDRAYRAWMDTLQ